MDSPSAKLLTCCEQMECSQGSRSGPETTSTGRLLRSITPTAVSRMPLLAHRVAVVPGDSGYRRRQLLPAAGKLTPGLIVEPAET